MHLPSLPYTNGGMPKLPAATRVYYAASVEDAVDRANGDFGPDALLVYSRKAPTESRHRGEYEVAFAAPEAAAPESWKPAAALPNTPELNREIESLRQEISGLLRLVTADAIGASGRGRVTGRKRKGTAEHVGAILADRLESQGFAENLALELGAAVERGLAGAEGSAAVVERCLHQELRTRLTPLQEARGLTPPRALAFVGPPGGGKTALMMKLASGQATLAGRRPILVNTDTYRIGAADQLARYAAILGVPLETADTPRAWRQLLAGGNDGSLLLIDTPGLSGGDLKLLEPLRAFLAESTGVETHLVLPATMRTRDLERAAQFYRGFHPACLAFTRLDETDCFGPLLSCVCQWQLPISYFSTGQRIPDDIETPTMDALLRLYSATATVRGGAKSMPRPGGRPTARSRARSGKR